MSSNRTIRIPVLILFGLETEEFDLKSCKERVVPSFPHFEESKRSEIEKLENKITKQGRDPRSDIYRTKIDGEHTELFATINCKAYRGEHGGICPYCLRSFKGECMGYAIDRDATSYYTTDNYFCSPGHAWGYLKRLRMDNLCERNRIETLTKAMYLEVYNVQIGEVKDCRLLWSEVCTLDDFDNPTIEYVKDPVTKIVPVKEQFQKKK